MCHEVCGYFLGKDLLVGSQLYLQFLELIFYQGLINLFQQISSNIFYNVPFFFSFSLILLKEVVGSSRLSAIIERS